jgi:hypothetical protein
MGVARLKALAKATGLSIVNKKSFFLLKVLFFNRKDLNIDNVG